MSSRRCLLFSPSVFFLPVCIFPLILVKPFHLHIPNALWEIITVLGYFNDLVLYGRPCAESAEMNKNDIISAFGKCLFISRPGSALSQTIQGPAFGNCCVQAIYKFTLLDKDKWYHTGKGHIPAHQPKGKPMLLSLLIFIPGMEPCQKIAFSFMALHLTWWSKMWRVFLPLS